MTKLQFFPIDVTYKLIDGVPVIHVFGRTISNEQVLLLDDSSRPYFYVLLKKGESNEQFMQKLNRKNFEAKKAAPKILRMELVEKNFMGQDLNSIKIVVNEPAATGIIAEELEKCEEVQNVSEADIPFERRYLVDNSITPMVLCETDGEEIPYRAKIKTYKTNKITPLTDVFEKPKVLAFDIETYNPMGKRVLPEEHPIIMVAFASDNFQKVITWKRFWEHQNYVEFVESEAELIEKFKEIIDQQRPDILAGYFSDGFDLPYLQARASKYKIMLDIGLDHSAIKTSRRAEFQTVAITGIAHFDVFKFVRRVIGKSLDTSSYTLDLVAKEMLGETKTEVDMDKLAEIWDNHPEQIGQYCEYNLQDSVLTLKLAQKLLPNILEFIKIIGLPLFDINRMSYSQYVEWYLIRQTKNFNQLIPNKPSYREIRERRLHTYTGAFVYEPRPGLYEDIVIYDFRSLYPTIISSHNIGPSTINCDCCAEDSERIPIEDKEYWFCKKKKGFIPTITEDLVKRRMRIKEMIKEEKEKKQKNISLEARSIALKDLSNSFYGYLGFFAARWYSLESARSTTAYGRYYIMMVIEEAKKAGFEVVYSDTDSIFIALGNKTKEDSKKFAELINLKLPKLMELEFEGFYPRGIFVFAKEAEYGAKKKYALLSQDETIKIRGFEMVRRNWSLIGKEVQENVLKIILKENDTEKALSYTKKIIAELRQNKIPLNKVIIYTQLQKDTQRYDAKGPHVAVAERMQQKGLRVAVGQIIEFVIAKAGDKIRDKARLPEEVTQQDYDPSYYIHHQIVPAVERIFNVIGYTEEDLLEEKEQSKLDKFF